MTEEEVLEMILVAKDMASKVMDTVRQSVEALDKSSQGTTKTTGTLTQMANQARDSWLSLSSALAGVTVLVKETTDFLGDCVSAFAEEEGIIIRTNAILSAHKILTEENSAAIQQYALALANQSRFAQDDIQSGMNLLMTFNLFGPALNKATHAAIQLASGLGIDLNTAFMMLAKASQGSTAALGRYGLVIKDDLPPAQKFEATLKLINERFSGVAQADIASFAGLVGFLGKQWGEAKEGIGKAVAILASPLLPRARDMLLLLTAATEQLAKWVESLSPATKALILGLTAAGIAATGLVMAFGAFLVILPGLLAGWTALDVLMGANPIGLIAAAIVITIAEWTILLGLIYLTRDVIVNTFRNLLMVITTTATQMWSSFKSLADGLWQIFSIIFNLISGGLFNVLKSVVAAVVSVMQNLFGLSRGFLSTLWEMLAGVASSIGQAMVTAFNAVVNALVQMFGWLWEKVKGLIGGIKELVTWLLPGLLPAITQVEAAIKDLAVSSYTGGVNIGKALAQGMTESKVAVLGAINDLTAAARSYIPTAPDLPALTGPLMDINNAGVAVPTSIAEGIDAGSGMVLDALGGLGAQMLDGWQGYTDQLGDMTKNALGGGLGDLTGGGVGAGVGGGGGGETGTGPDYYKSLLDFYKQHNLPVPTDLIAKLQSFGIWVFASGGIVTRPTLGLVGEAGPEAIIPLNRLGMVGGGSMNVTLVFNSTIMPSDQEIRAGVRRIYSIFKSEEARRG